MNQNTRLAVSDRIIVSIAFTMLFIGLLVLAALQFSLFPNSISQSAYILCAFIMLFASVGSFMLTVSAWPRKVAHITAAVGILQLGLSAANFAQISNGKQYFSLGPDNTLTLLFASTLFLLPCALTSLYILYRQKRAGMAAALILSAVAVFFTVLLVYALPRHQELTALYERRNESLAQADKETALLKSQQKSENTAQQALSDELGEAAKTIARTIRQSVNSTGKVPASIVAPEGFAVVEYQVVEGGRTHFCINKVGVPVSTTSVLTAPTGASDMLYSVSAPTEGTCSYEDFYFVQLD